jgi:endonuclease/exonuclease/phosphatase family metal-dependent hydrolase
MCAPRLTLLSSLLLVATACAAPTALPANVHSTPPPAQAAIPLGGAVVLPRDHVLARRAPGDLRVVSYNIWHDSIFQAGSDRQQRFVRVARALDADVWALQEVHARPEDAERLFDRLLPLPAGRHWHARYAATCLTVSRYPILSHRYRTPHAAKMVGLSLVDLPDDRYRRDLYVVHAGFTCCGGPANDPVRQREADQVAAWLRDVKVPGQPWTLAAGTPIVVAGDLNIIASRAPVRTLVEGDIHDEATFGPDAAPDWDGTALADPEPRHLARGSETWTWRSDGSGFPPGRLDYVLFSDSVLQAVHAFVLDTVALTVDERRDAGLRDTDVVLGPGRLGEGYRWDHLPVVVDFRER